MWDGIYAQNRSVIKRTIAGETLLVPVSGTLADMQRLFVLDPVGTQVWDRLDGVRSLEEIHAQLLALFEVSPGRLKTDLLEFIGELERAGLVAPASGRVT